MAVLPVIIAPDPRLERVSKPVEVIDKEIHKIIDDMIETMRAAPASGLAAPQVGIMKRILVLDISSYYDKPWPEYVMINPEVLYTSEETWTTNEGCLSFPINERFPVTRPENLRLRYLDRDGKQNEIEADGWFARGILHELDHLNGITMLHYMSKLKRDIITKKLIKYKKARDL